MVPPVLHWDGSSQVCTGRTVSRLATVDWEVVDCVEEGTTETVELEVEDEGGGADTLGGDGGVAGGAGGEAGPRCVRLSEQPVLARVALPPSWSVTRQAGLVAPWLLLTRAHSWTDHVAGLRTSEAAGEAGTCAAVAAAVAEGTLSGVEVVSVVAELAGLGAGTGKAACPAVGRACIQCRRSIIIEAPPIIHPHIPHSPMNPRHIRVSHIHLRPSESQSSPSRHHTDTP